METCLGTCDRSTLCLVITEHNTTPRRIAKSLSIVVTWGYRNHLPSQHILALYILGNFKQSQIPKHQRYLGQQKLIKWPNRSQLPTQSRPFRLLWRFRELKRTHFGHTLFDIIPRRIRNLVYLSQPTSRSPPSVLHIFGKRRSSWRQGSSNSSCGSSDLCADLP